MSLAQMEALDAAEEDDDAEAREALYMEAFQKYDADGSGDIDPEELRLVIEELGEDLEPEEVDKLISDADAVGDGNVNFQEFVHMMNARKRLLALANALNSAQQSEGEGSVREEHCPERF